MLFFQLISGLLTNLSNTFIHVWQFAKFRLKIGNKTVLKTITWSGVVSGGVVVVSANKISC